MYDPEGWQWKLNEKGYRGFAFRREEHRVFRSPRWGEHELKFGERANNGLQARPWVFQGGSERPPVTWPKGLQSRAFQPKGRRNDGSDQW